LIDYTIPTGPEIVGWLETPGFAVGVAVNDTMAFIADMHYGLQVVDIRDPAHPQIIGSVNTPGLAHDVTVHGNWAYVADDNWGVRVVDVSTPEDPVDMGYVDTAEHATDVAVHGDLLLVADSEDDLVIMDITTPSSPVIVSTLDLGDLVRDVDLNAQLGVAVGYYGTYILDLTNPFDPQIIDIIAMSSSAVSIVDSFIIAIGDDIVIIDISDLDDPRIIGSAHLPYPSSGIAYTGTSIMTAGGDVYMAWPHCIDPVFVPIIPQPVTACPFRMTVSPNPFNPCTTMTFSVAVPQSIMIDVLDLSGRRISILANREFGASDHEITWSGRDASGRLMPSGSYILRLQSKHDVSTRKISLVR